MGNFNTFGILTTKMPSKVFFKYIFFVFKSIQNCKFGKIQAQNL
jgi:hypothetical protein